jgi:two-component system sensor histidine kinase LytS
VITSWKLLIVLGQGMSVVVTIAFLLTRLNVIKRLFNNQIVWKDKLILILIFGLIGIIGTYTGQNMDGGAIANSRVIGVLVGGLLGGPIVGVGAGMIAGIHRFTLGGFTAFSCSIATILEGLLGGLIARKLGRDRLTWKTALLIGFVAELMQMLIILLVAKPFDQAWALVQVIGLPMIIMNSVGIAIFIVIIKSVFEELDREGAVQAQKSLIIAERTLPFLRNGLNSVSAMHVAKIIKESTSFDAVAIIKETEILCHIGAGESHHLPGHKLVTKSTFRSMQEANPIIAKTPDEIGCNDPLCPLQSAIVIPLKNQKKIMGALKLYYSKRDQITHVDYQFAVGLAHLISTQLDIATLEQQKQLVQRAEIKMLQAQVNPHFLFNALNTIHTYCRTSPELARKLIIQLSHFLRKNLDQGDFVTLEQELEHIKSYVAIEEARFREKVEIQFRIEESILQNQVPKLLLQPLVENSLKHGILPQKEGGLVTIEAKQIIEEGHKKIELCIRDNGVGIEHGKLELLRNKEYYSPSPGHGIGLSNVQERVNVIYGKLGSFQLESRLNIGTKITVKIPMKNKNEEDEKYDPYTISG